MIVALLWILFLILIVFYLLFAFSKRLKDKLTGKNGARILIGYVVLLLLITISSFGIDNESLQRKPLATVDEMKQHEKEQLALYQALENGNFPSGLGHTLFLKKSWIFPIHEKKIVFAFDSDHNGDQALTNVYVERKPGTAGKIEIQYYHGRSFQEGFDYTHTIMSPIVQHDGQRIIVTDQNKTAKLGALNEVVASRFLQNMGDTEHEVELTSHGISFLYVKVPKGVKVSEEKGEVSFVTKP
ncbi:hypothetical protein A374_13980 [Fictibacillus macauensis ZFHKF-1]|uniref:Uncharacterized protein n=1 Tax=Fictibacillus macauensis ZFHKF-1 TaxID=1196324 RepID=I8IZ85_9BACL|nr:hypothetical protein [Fictibacillus macauensis]EIT84806.1 hypothetical protein A374_13980 [Fictibacillus macauensis ZFHKF-1]